MFGTAIAGGLADRFKADMSLTVLSSAGDLTEHCLGNKCYFLSLMVTTAASLMAALAALWLLRRQHSGTANTLRMGLVDRYIEEDLAF